MNTTTNYSLPQWEATDAVKRGDVNSAMAAIDAAIASAGGAVLIKSLTLDEGASSITIPTTDIDWSEWCTVYLVFLPNVTGKYSLETSTVSYSTTLLSDQINSIRMRVDVAREPTIMGIYYAVDRNGATKNGHMGAPFHELKQLKFTGTFNAGTTYKLWGQR